MQAERSRLLPNVSQPPQYVFETSLNERKRRVKRFQYCLWAIFLSVVIVALVAVIAYNLSQNVNEEDNNNNITSTLTNDSFLVLLAKSFPLHDNDDTETPCNEEDWENVGNAGQEALNIRDDLEKTIPHLHQNSPSYRHQKATATSPRANFLARYGYMEEVCTKSKKKNFSNATTGNNNYKKYCMQLKQIKCNTYERYRSYNGSCNNLKYPNKFGVAYQPFRRILKPDYADGISSPRISKRGKPLPSARTVSLVVHRPYYRSDQKFSVMLAVWGQFLDHDITATALSQPSSGTISCCNGGTLHTECFPVELDPLDPLYQYNVSCIEFVRSAPAPTCCLGPRQQLNQVTAFIDGSVIYGAEENVVKNLRTYKGGLLDMYLTGDNRTLLPVSKDPTDGCNRVDEAANGRYCFLTGDGRANENLHLTTMHLIWARHHNFVATELSRINPHWKDERLFQEARKIVGAQMQHITYKEFLPILFGSSLMQKFDLNPGEDRYFDKYNDTLDPSIANCFASAAFRFAHTIIPGLMKFLSNNTSSPEYVQLHKMLFDPFKLYQPGELDRALKGAMDTNIEGSDPYFTSELKEHLFERHDEKQKKCGLDLVSLNIQRGRDHGLPGYNKWRQHCGLERWHRFEELKQDLDKNALREIEGIYSEIDDIDLYTGAISEKPLNGSILGPTFTCLILNQFIKMKYGDRFWYENPHVFTLDQLNEIRNSSLARVICDNSDDVDTIQPLVMEKTRSGNELIACESIPLINFEHWKDVEVKIKVPNNELFVRHSG